MQSRYAAFAVLRRLAMQDLAEVPRRLPRWNRLAARPFEHLAPRPFYHSTRHSNSEQPTRTLPKEQPGKADVLYSPISLEGDNISLPFQEQHEVTDQSTRSERQEESENLPPPIPFDKQVYEMTFTCKPCGTRSTHQVSKQGYHFGSVLITCPECKNRHIMSDHLGIFLDRAMTVEDLMREKGQLVKKGTLSDDGDLEFWQDGTTTTRATTKATTRTDKSDGQEAPKST